MHIMQTMHFMQNMQNYKIMHFMQIMQVMQNMQGYKTMQIMHFMQGGKKAALFLLERRATRSSLFLPLAAVAVRAPHAWEAALSVMSLRAMPPLPHAGEANVTYRFRPPRLRPEVCLTAPLSAACGGTSPGGRGKCTPVGGG